MDAADAEALRLKEHGLDAYVVVNHRHFSVNAEYVRAHAAAIASTGARRART